MRRDTKLRTCIGPTFGFQCVARLLVPILCGFCEHTRGSGCDRVFFRWYLMPVFYTAVNSCSNIVEKSQLKSWHPTGWWNSYQKENVVKLLIFCFHVTFSPHLVF